MSRHLLTHVLFASFILACGAQKPGTPDGPDVGTNATNTRIRLTVQGPTRVVVPPTRSATIRIAATLSQGGAPVQGLPVRFSLQGAGGNSSLSSAAVNTDDDGIALVVFTAGAMNATTRIVAQAQDASNAQVDMVIDGSANGQVNGAYQFSTTVQPLEFMNRNSKTYVYTSNIVNLLVDPVSALLSKWLKFDDATQTSQINTSVALCYGATGFGSAACIVAQAAVMPIINALLGLDTSGTATQVHNALTSAGMLVQTVNVGGALNIKTYDETAETFTGTLNFDTYRLLWSGSSQCANNTDACCGHSLFDATKMNVPPFLKLCATQADAAMPACTADLTGTLKKVTGQKGHYTLSLNQGSLSIAYGTLLKAALEVAIFPAALSPSRFPPDADGHVTLQTLVHGLVSCPGSTNDPNYSATLCGVISAALTPILGLAVAGLDGLGTSDSFANATITNASLVDTNNDGQADSLTGALTLTTAGTGNTGTQSPPINGIFSRQICTGDASCGAGFVCTFQRDSIDGCFARNQCQPVHGTKTGYADCTNNSECQSGTCIAQAPSANFTSVNVNHCYQACSADTDCGGGHCDLHGYVSVLDNGATTTGTCIH